MELESRRLTGLYNVILAPYRDHRGFLTRAYDADLFQCAGVRMNWVQHLISYTERRNTLRGLHAQMSPFSEAKLITPLSGEMFWVVVDLRLDSPTFGQWEGDRLTPEEGRGLLVSRGFGHGCLSMTDGVMLSIVADNRYSLDHGVGIRWDDPDLAIEWPRIDGHLTLSDAHVINPDFHHFRKTVGGL